MPVERTLWPDLLVQFAGHCRTPYPAASGESRFTTLRSTPPKKMSILAPVLPTPDMIRRPRETPPFDVALQLSALLSKGLSKTVVDRPINVEGCSAASNLRRAQYTNKSPSQAALISAQHPNAFRVTRARGGTKTPPHATTSSRSLQRSRRRKPGRGRRSIAEEESPPGGVTALSLAELSPPFFGRRTSADGADFSGAAALSPIATGDVVGFPKENVEVVRPENQGPTSPNKRKITYIPTVGFVL